jgi:8-oxo-dGTP pyrophosphatase MutT (NUDIX family)
LVIPHEKIGEVKESAVLVLLFLKNNDLCLCLTRRNPNMKHHPGQISFPGGQCEEEESIITETALRELEEETGIDKTKVRIIGKLSDLYVHVSNFLIHPIVGYIDHEPKFKIDPFEVEELIFIPLQSFLGKNNITLVNIEIVSGKLKVPCYKINDWVIWGATAMIIAELTVLLAEFLSLPVKR